MFKHRRIRRKIKKLRLACEHKKNSAMSWMESYASKTSEPLHRANSLIWYKKGKVHRGDDLPAMICRDRKIWIQNDKIHRDEDKPAIVFEMGTKMWYQNGQVHRDKGPAIMQAHGISLWYHNGYIIEPPLNNIELNLQTGQKTENVLDE